MVLIAKGFLGSVKVRYGPCLRAGLCNSYWAKITDPSVERLTESSAKSLRLNALRGCYAVI